MTEKPRPAAKAPRPGMPEGFALANEPGRRDCHFGTGYIGGDAKHVRVVLAPEKVSIHTTPTRVSEIGFSADFWRFFLPRSALHGWRPGRPAVIDIPVESFPEGLRGIFSARRYHVDATITSEGVFRAPRPPLPLETPAPKPKRRGRPALQAAIVAVVVMGAAAGTMAVAHGPDAGGWVMTAMLQALEVSRP